MPSRPKSNSGRALQREWNIPAKHVLYHHEGTWFHLLEQFPGALCDPYGYVIFSTRKDFVNCPQLRVAAHTKAPGGIQAIPSYVRMRKA
jgi:5-methylcytosine-specific restriction protein A